MSPLTAYVVETVVSLLAILALAVLVLFGARRLGIGRPSGPLALVGRLPLDGRRAVYLVRVGTRVYVLGASEAGLAKIGETSEDALGAVEATATTPTFARALERAIGKAERPRDAVVAAQPGEPPEDDRAKTS